jgi:hypothetical protein
MKKTRREFLVGLAVIAASAKFPEVVRGQDNLEEIIKKFKLTRTVDKNLEIVKSLSPEEFHLLYKNLGFEKLRSLVRYTICYWNPIGHERVENMRKLLPMINDYSNQYDFNATRVFSHIFWESGGDNNLNCDVNPDSDNGGGGVMHLLDVHWDGINPLNEEQNIMRGVEYLSKLKREFDDDEDIASMAFNLGPGRKNSDYGIRANFYRVRDFFNSTEREDRKITSDEVIWMMKKYSPYHASIGKRYINNLNSSWDKVTKEELFMYDEKSNWVSYIGSKGGIKLEEPKPPELSKWKKEQIEEREKAKLYGK